jgi:hypothetical protein
VKYQARLEPGIPLRAFLPRGWSGAAALTGNLPVALGDSPAEMRKLQQDAVQRPECMNRRIR